MCWCLGTQDAPELSCSTELMGRTVAELGDLVLHLSWVCPQCPVLSCPAPGGQGGFCMLCVMQNHTIQAFANSGNAIKPLSFIRDLKSKDGYPALPLPSGSRAGEQ